MKTHPLPAQADNYGNPLVICPVCKQNQAVLMLRFPEGDQARMASHYYEGQHCLGSQRDIPGFFL